MRSSTTFYKQIYNLGLKRQAQVQSEHQHIILIQKLQRVFPLFLQFGFEFGETCSRPELLKGVLEKAECLEQKIQHLKQSKSQLKSNQFYKWLDKLQCSITKILQDSILRAQYFQLKNLYLQNLHQFAFTCYEFLTEVISLVKTRIHSLLFETQRPPKTVLPSIVRHTEQQKSCDLKELLGLSSTERTESGIIYRNRKIKRQIQKYLKSHCSYLQEKVRRGYESKLLVKSKMSLLFTQSDKFMLRRTLNPLLTNKRSLHQDQPRLSKPELVPLKLGLFRPMLETRLISKSNDGKGFPKPTII